MIKAINTQYKGYNFRSRTEARWAVFLDALGFEWEYEREGFHLPSGPYLPDFYLTQYNTYLEVKGQKFTELERQKCKELSLEYDVVLLDGSPAEKTYELYMGGEQMSDVVFIPEGQKYAPFYYCGDWDPEWFPETIECIKEALSARFEHGQTPKHANKKYREDLDKGFKPITPDPVEYAKLVKEVTEINTKLGFDWNGESI